MLATILLMAMTVLPGEPATVPALSPYPFPDRMSAFVWRNWFCVPVERLAETVKATPAELTGVASEMGLPEQPKILPEWKDRGYITIVRRNWHLLDYDQLIRLLGITREEMRFRLLEDDFLWSKLGSIKPKCDPLFWDSAEAGKGRGGRARLAEAMKAEKVSPSAPEKPRFSFVREISCSDPDWKRPAPAESPFSVRYLASYFADYASPLDDPEIGSFPEGLLQKLADQGVNGVWLHVVLRTLCKDPLYPEFGVGCEKRIENLRTLVARAEKYGIKVYLYLNEPRGMTADFFAADKRREAMRGCYEERTTRYALCTSSPETLRWLKSSVEKVFRAAPGLGGIFTITASENLTTCASHNHKDDCPRCAKRAWSDIIAEVNSAMIDGMHQASSEALAFVWDWGWWGYPVPRTEEEQNSVLTKLPKHNVKVLAVSEYGMPLARGGIKTTVREYSISAVGPGDRAKGRWNAAKENGLEIAAKIQAGVSWEMSPFPYLPVMDLVAQHAVNLARAGIDSVMMSWSLGGAPAPNLRIWDLVKKGDADSSAVLDRLAAELYGESAAPLARKAWTAFSNGYAEYPFHIKTLYRGPQNWGPANPLYPEPTKYTSTMVGFPYDDFVSWRADYPEDIWIAQMDKVADGFDEGCRLFAEVVGAVSADRRSAAERELAMFRAEALHLRSCAEQGRFVQARDRGNRTAMLESVRRELAAAKALLPLTRADSRIGYESSNHYFYTPLDIVEKIIICHFMLEKGGK